MEEHNDITYDLDSYEWKNGLKDSEFFTYICKKCLSRSLKPSLRSLINNLGHEDVMFIDSDADEKRNFHFCLECEVEPEKSKIFIIATIVPFMIERIEQRFKRSGDVSNYGWFTSESDRENGFPMRHGLKLYVREIGRAHV